MTANLNAPTQSKTTKSSKPTKARRAGKAGKAESTTGPTRKTRLNAPAKKSPSKKTLIERALATKGGASIADLMKITGWQDHSVRAALSGLRKQGHPIERHQAKGAKDKPAVYRIVGDQTCDTGRSNKSDNAERDIKSKSKSNRSSQSTQTPKRNRKGNQA